MRSQLQKLRISQRLMVLPLVASNQFPQMLEILKSNRGAVDDVWLFTENDGQDFRHISMPEVSRRATILADIIEQLKAEGIRASINILNTIGHTDYAEPFLDPLPYGGMVGPEGLISLCCGCPRQPAFHDYVIAKYTAYAKAMPDAIWIDDDTRLFHHPPRASHGCFCDTCLAEYSWRTGKTWSRESVVQAIVRNDYPGPNKDRQAWMRFLSEQLVELHHILRDAIRGVDSKIEIGGMNSHFPWFTGYFSRFAERWEALRSSPDEVVLARPGGGFFSDDRPVEAYHKAWSVAFQNAQYPANVERHVEVENYPFQLFGKSIASTVLEGSLYLAIGSEGLAFDVCGNLGNDPREQAQYIQAISKRRPYYELVHASSHGASSLGLNVAFDPEHAGWATSDGKTFESTDARMFPLGCEWGMIGIPLRFACEGCGPSLLVGDLAKGFSPETLETILKNGVVMDADTLVHLWKVGLGAKLGVNVAKAYTTGTFERFTKHPLNGGFENYTREVSQGYFGSTTSTFKSEGGDLQPLSKLFNYRNQELGTCAVALETSFGSRVLVLGYRPWDFLGIPGKNAQCRQIVDWLHAGQRVPRFDGNEKSVFHAWTTNSGRFGGTFYNASGDPIMAPRFVGLPSAEKLDVVAPDLSRFKVTISLSGEAVLPDVPAWGEYLIST